MSTTGGQEPSETAKRALQARAVVTGMSDARCLKTRGVVEGLGCAIPYPAASLAPDAIAGAAGNSAAAIGCAVAAVCVDVDMPASTLIAEAGFDLLARGGLRCGRGLRLVPSDCDDDRHERRYTDTQRSHLLAGARSLMDGIRHKRQMPSTLRDCADLLIEESLPSATEPEAPVDGGFAPAEVGLRVFVTSFAHRPGIRRAADAGTGVFANARYRQAMRALAGGGLTVSARVESSRQPWLTITVGCTAGRYRVLEAPQPLRQSRARRDDKL